MVARRLLPASPAYLLDRQNRVITGARPRSVSRHVGRTRRRNHDGRATRTGGLVEANRVVGGIRRVLTPLYVKTRVLSGLDDGLALTCLPFFGPTEA